MKGVLYTKPRIASGHAKNILYLDYSRAISRVGWLNGE